MTLDVFWNNLWIFRLNNLSFLLSKDIAGEVSALLSGIKESDGKNNKRTYFSSPRDFLESWRTGYEKWASWFWESLYDALGFELYYVDIDTKSDFFRIGEHTGFWWREKEISPFLLCADANWLYDQKWYMNLWVNDISDKRVKVYRWKDEHNKNIWYELVSQRSYSKHLSLGKSFYVWDFPENFPFWSANALKSSGNMWHMIGHTPQELYSELEKIGFTFEWDKKTP